MVWIGKSQNIQDGSQQYGFRCEGHDAQQNLDDWNAEVGRAADRGRPNFFPSLLRLRDKPAEDTHACLELLQHFRGLMADFSLLLRKLGIDLGKRPTRVDRVGPVEE